MTESDLDAIMRKVFKREFDCLDEYQAVIEHHDLFKMELLEKYTQLLESYQDLLNDAVKITKIGDINQKKLFEANEELEEQKKLLYLSSITDQLTQIYNRTYLIQVLKDEFAKSKRYQHTFSCIFIDIDDFKAVNDSYGHQVGDIVLVKTTAIIKTELREVDSFGRYGGEEFMIILPSTHAQGAALVAEKIRLKVAETEFFEQGHHLSVTISQGISDVSIDDPQSEDELLYRVDTALYQAKKKGKNCSVIFDNTEQPRCPKPKA